MCRSLVSRSCFTYFECYRSLLQKSPIKETVLCKRSCFTYFTCVSATQHTATHCNALQHTATHCNTLQHTVTHCNTLSCFTYFTCVSATTCRRWRGKKNNVAALFDISVFTRVGFFFLGPFLHVWHIFFGGNSQTMTWKKESCGGSLWHVCFHTCRILFLGPFFSTCVTYCIFSDDLQTMTWKKESCGGPVPAPRAGRNSQKVSVLLNSLFTRTVELTFENLFQGIPWRCCR